MTPRDRRRFGARRVVLAGGVQAVIRPLRRGDADALGDFYESIPRRDYRFYRAAPLTREMAYAEAAAADRPDRAVLLLIPAPHTGAGSGHSRAASGSTDIVGGHVWSRWADGADRSVLGLCVRPGFQRLGAGAALMARLLEVGVSLGPPVMTLTVQQANPRAIRLYRKMGFRTVREQMRPANRWFAAEPEYYMERTITQGHTKCGILRSALRDHATRSGLCEEDRPDKRDRDPTSGTPAPSISR